jgi:leucyl-tRNA synthetase
LIHSQSNKMLFLYRSRMLSRPKALSAQHQPIFNYRSKNYSTENKKYVLSMFPYPSGNLHMGHVRVYTISDVLSRAFRMNGYRVLHPMGWDAFGLPAENAAIERGIDPATWTKLNINQMKTQLNLLDLNFDWDREVVTCSPDYYKWTQWLFLQLLKTGHAYKRESYVNWDPVDQTVLANEQVDATGRSWRSGALVEKKKLNQWYFAIKKFAHDLLHDLDELSEWPESVKMMQRAWIGESKGAEFIFKIKDSDLSLKVFTTRPDTIFGVTYLALAPESDLVQQISPINERETVSQFIQRLQSMSGTKRTEHAGISKEGHFLGVYAIHPLTNKLIPVYIADYVIAEFAEGCVMGVPAHDTRDFEFATRHNIDIIQVIEPVDKSESNECYIGDGVLINSGDFNGISNLEAKKLIVEYAQKLGFGCETINYKLRDWLVSRQRYWGTPIPIINCPQCGPVPVPENELPVLLPEGLMFQSMKGNPLATADNWLNVKCPCGKGVDCKRETDTMDTFVDSSWYYLRYTDAKNNERVFDPEIAKKWMNVDFYIGGIEHAVLHLLYSRFIYKFLKSQGYVLHKEPFRKLLTQGMVQGETFKDPETDRYYKPDEIQRLEDGTVIDKKSGVILKSVWEKMSKSKYNGVDPTDIVSKHGSDVVRLYILFKAPIEKELEWDPQQIVGQERFLKRTEALANSFADLRRTSTDYRKVSDISSHLVELSLLIEQTRKNLYDEQVLNTCVSNLHKYTNTLHEMTKNPNVIYTKAFELAIINLSVMMAPFAPSFSDRMFKTLIEHLPSNIEWRKVSSVHDLPFPTSDIFKKLIQEDANEQNSVKITLSFNGKVRGFMEVTKDILQDTEKLKEIISASKEGQKYLPGGVPSIQKIVVVSHRNLVNIVH